MYLTILENNLIVSWGLKSVFKHFFITVCLSQREREEALLSTEHKLKQFNQFKQNQAHAVTIHNRTEKIITAVLIFFFNTFCNVLRIKAKQITTASTIACMLMAVEMGFTKMVSLQSFVNGLQID